MENKRPPWAHKLTESDARWFRDHRVTKITTSYKMTGPDTSDDFVHFWAGAKALKRHSYFLRDHENFLQFRPDGHGLIEFTPFTTTLKDLANIDRFEQDNKHDRSEYERLKKKFKEKSHETL